MRTTSAADPVVDAEAGVALGCGSALMPPTTQVFEHADWRVT